MMHGSLDNGGGLISFHRVSKKFCCHCGFFPSTVNLQKAKHSGPNCRMKTEWIYDLYTVTLRGVTWVYLLKIKSSDIAVLHTVAVRESTSLICAFNEKAQAEKDQSVLKVSL